MYTPSSIDLARNCGITVEKMKGRMRVGGRTHVKEIDRVG